jgi:5'-nucleotidase
VGHGITLHKPLRLNRVVLRDGREAYAVNGMPPDCVLLGLREVAPDADMVISGINRGANLGEDVIYSGTVAGAREGALNDVPSVAISSVSTTLEDFTDAARIARIVVEQVAEHGLPPGVFLNVNIPALPWEQIRGFRLARQGRRRYPLAFERRVDPRGGVYYWLGGGEPADPLVPGTDVAAVKEGYVAVVPVHFDLTAYTYLEAWREWVEGWPMG